MVTGFPHVHRRRARPHACGSVAVQVFDLHVPGHLDATGARDDRISEEEVQRGTHDDVAISNVLVNIPGASETILLRSVLLTVLLPSRDG